MRELNPNIVALVASERQFTDMRSGPKVRRVKIDKLNEAWLVRFLPVALGPSNLFYVRIGQHWLNKKPIFCPRNVAPDFGGDPDASCAVCDMSDRLLAENEEELSDKGWKLHANVVHLTYCCVFAVDPGSGRGEIQNLPQAETLRPWEFTHFKTSFEELTDFFRRGRSASRPLSVLDLRAGNDFWVTKTSKGMRLDRNDPTPIFELTPDFNKKVATVMNAIQDPKIVIPTEKQLAIFAQKAEADAYGDNAAAAEERGGRGGRGGRGVATDSNGDGEEEPAARPGRVISHAPQRSTGRPAPLPAEEEEQVADGSGGAEAAGEIEDNTPVQGQDAEPAPEEGNEAEPVSSEQPEETNEQEPQPQDEDGTGVDVVNGESQESDQIPGAEAPAPASNRPRPSPVPARTVPMPARAPQSIARPTARVLPRTTPTPPAAASRQTVLPRAVATGRDVPPAASTRRPPAAATQPTVTEEEDPGIAEEAVDPVQPANKPLPENKPRASTANPAMQAKLMARIRGTAQR